MFFVLFPLRLLLIFVQTSTVYSDAGSTASTAHNVRAMKTREMLTKSPIDGRINLAAVAVFTVAAVLSVEFMFPRCVVVAWRAWRGVARRDWRW